MEDRLLAGRRTGAESLCVFFSFARRVHTRVIRGLIMIQNVSAGVSLGWRRTGVAIFGSAPADR